MSNAIVVNGQVGLLTSRQQLAAAGKYFNVTNPTPGTAIAYANQTSFSATANGLFSISNNNPSGGSTIQLDRLVLTQTATAPTGLLVYRFEVYTETGIAALSGNAAARTPVNVNPSVPNTTGAIVTSFAAGAATVPAAVGTRRLIDVVAVQTGGATVIHDSIVLEFGSDSIATNPTGATAARAASCMRLIGQAAPVTIAPQSTVFINSWTLTGAANVPSYEFSLTFIET